MIRICNKIKIECAPFWGEIVEGSTNFTTFSIIPLLVSIIMILGVYILIHYILFFLESL